MDWAALCLVAALIRGWASGIYRKINKTNHILLIVIEIYLKTMMTVFTLLIPLVVGFFGWWGTIHYNNIKEKLSELGNLEAEILVNRELSNNLTETLLYLREDGWNDFRKRGGSKFIHDKSEDFAKCYSLLWQINAKIHSRKEKNLSDENFKKIEQDLNKLRKCLQDLLDYVLEEKKRTKFLRFF